MLISLIVRSVRPYGRRVTLIIVFQAIATMASLQLPSLNADIIDNGVATGDTGYIVGAGGQMLLLTVVQIVASIAATWFSAGVAMGVGRDLRAGIFHHVGTFSAREMGRFGAASLITRNTNDVQQVQILVLMTFTMLVMAPIMAVGGIVMAMREGFSLSWLLLVSVPALILAVAFIVSRMIPGFRKVQERTDDVNRVLREQIAGIRVVRAFVREDSESARFATSNDQLTDASIWVGQWMALMFPTVMFVFNVSSVAVLWFGAGPVDDGSLQIGSLTAFLSYLMQILMAVMMATFVAVLAPRASVSADRIGEVLATKSSVAPPQNPVTDVVMRGHVELREVTFHYPGAELAVLRGVSFAAGPGRTTAIIGSTGAGKTTLLNLIPRLFDVTGGAVLVDGVDVRTLDPDVLWSRIGVVPQAAYLFNGTIASNLRYGLPSATEAEMWDALVGRPGGRLRARPARRSGGARRPGRHELLRWPAPAAGDRQSTDPAAGDLPVRRCLLGARPRHRCPTARCPGAADPRCCGDHRRPASVDDHRRRRDRRPRGWARRWSRDARRVAGRVPDLRRDRRVTGGE